MWRSLVNPASVEWKLLRGNNTAHQLRDFLPQSMPALQAQATEVCRNGFVAFPAPSMYSKSQRTSSLKHLFSYAAYAGFANHKQQQLVPRIPGVESHALLALWRVLPSSCSPRLWCKIAQMVARFLISRDIRRMASSPSSQFSLCHPPRFSSVPSQPTIPSLARCACHGVLLSQQPRWSLGY
jgi:hypothetical protein